MSCGQGAAPHAPASWKRSGSICANGTNASQVTVLHSCAPIRATETTADIASELPQPFHPHPIRTAEACRHQPHNACAQSKSRDRRRSVTSGLPSWPAGCAPSPPDHDAAQTMFLTQTHAVFKCAQLPRIPGTIDLPV